MRRTLHFLFLQLQLGLHVLERGLDLLKVFVRFRVCDVKTLMLPLLFSVKAGEKSEEQGSAHGGNHSRGYAFQLPLHRLRLRVFTHELAESGVADIQTKRSSQSDELHKRVLRTHIFCISFFLLFISALLMSNLALESACKLKVLISPFKSSLRSSNALALLLFSAIFSS